MSCRPEYLGNVNIYARTAPPSCRRTVARGRADAGGHGRARTLELFNRELKRRTEVMGIPPQQAALTGPEQPSWTSGTANGSCSAPTT